MIDKKIITAAVLGLVLSAGVIFFISKINFSQQNITNLVVGDKNNETQKNADISITAKPNDNNSYNLILSTKSAKKLSGFSIRLTYPYKGGDFTTQSFIPNQDLIANEWVFPIKSINLDEANNIVKVDISGVNLSTTGYDFTSEVNLGTLSNFSSLTFSLDKGETKILEKSGQEVIYNFKQE